MIRTCIAVFLLCFVGAAQKRPVTLDAAVTPPRRASASVTWSPDGVRFLYTEQGRLMLCEVPSGQKKELLTLGALQDKALRPPAPEPFDWQNRRVSETNYQWAPSGKEILISAAGDLFLLHLDTGAWDQLTATAEPESDPKLSPDGSMVSFRRGHDLYSLEIAGRKVTRLTHDGSATLLNGELDWVYPEELDLGTAHWWSPDSRRIAYLQFDVSREPIFPHVDLRAPKTVFEPQRFPQPGMPNADVRLGVVSVSGGRTRWMDLGETRDALLARVAWSPDSRSLAAQRLNRIQNRLDLQLADAESGSARLVLREQDSAWVNVNDFFGFLENGKQFLWGSERDGYRHLYTFTLDGKPAKQLTKGEWEVTDVACVDEAAGEIFYVSTEASPLERQFYSVRLNGKGKRRLSQPEGTHSISMGPKCGHYLDTFSNLTSPSRVTLHDRQGNEVLVYRAAMPEQYEILPTEIVTVKAADGATLYARMIKPAGFTAGKKYPVIVMIYGGPHAQTVRNAYAGVSWDQALAQRGFVIWQLDNRGSSGRGHAWEAKVNRNLGALELQDQQNGIRRLESLGFADTSRMGIYGWSYGGYMTLYALTNAPKLFRAGIAGAPVTDWRNYDTIYTERYMGLPADNAEGYQRSSPLTSAKSLEAKLLLVHNFEDDNVHFQNTLQMADALEQAGKQFEMMLYPQKSHGVTGPVRRQMLVGMTEFFERNLK